MNIFWANKVIDDIPFKTSQLKFLDILFKKLYIWLIYLKCFRVRVICRGT